MSRAAGAPARPLRSLPSGPLAGRIRIPGDRSIGHRALVLGALAIGETVIEGLPDIADLRATAAALRAFGATLGRDGSGAWTVKGLGVGGLLEPEDVVDCGDAGTLLRLALGLAAGHAIPVTFTGTASLRGQGIGRVLEPLRRMGAQVLCRSRDRLPLTIRGADLPLPIDCRLAAQAQGAKSAVLFAGLNAPGVTSVIEAQPLRDHSERLLAAFGAAIETGQDGDGAHVVRIEGRRDLKPQRITVAGDPGLAAAATVAALIVEGSDVTLEGVSVNPLRLGLFEVLTEMGGDIALDNRRIAGGEPVADIRIRASRLRAIAVPAARAAAIADEAPALAVAAAFAEGRSVIEGLGGLRQGGTDRLAALAAGLAANGVAHEEGAESLAITGSARPAGGGRVAAGADPQVAIALAVLGLAAADGVAIDDASPLLAVYPDFTTLFAALGARFETDERS